MNIQYILILTILTPLTCNGFLHESLLDKNPIVLAAASIDKHDLQALNAILPQVPRESVNALKRVAEERLKKTKSTETTIIQNLTEIVNAFAAQEFANNALKSSANPKTDEKKQDPA